MAGGRGGTWLLWEPQILPAPPLSPIPSSLPHQLSVLTPVLCWLLTFQVWQGSRLAVTWGMEHMVFWPWPGKTVVAVAALVGPWEGGTNKEAEAVGEKW